MNKSIVTLLTLTIGASSQAQNTIPSSWALYPTTAVKAERTLAFGFDDAGVAMPILWGFDTAWNSETNMIRGVRYTGSDIIGVARVSFNPWAEITEKGVLPPLLMTHLDNRMRTVGLIGHKVDIALNLDGGAPTVKELYGGLDENNEYVGDPETVAGNYARLIDATAAAVEAKGYNVVSAAPFNEPDYFWNGTPINVFHEINKLLKNREEYPRFANIRISGGNTLNCDEALPWYTYLKDNLDEGNTHQLAGDFDHYAEFFTTVRNDGKYATADELHNVMEAMVGVEYGMQTGIWWGTAEQARGEFCKASTPDGRRLSYAENRKAWSSASVYRSPSGKLQGFAGCSERQARPSVFRYLSLSGDMFVDGVGPLREYFLSLPGDPNGAYQTELQRNAETVVNITRGDDPQPLVNGSYSIVNQGSRLVLGGRDNSTANLQRVEQQAYAGGDWQAWTVEPVPCDIGGDFSYYFIRNTHDHQALDDLDWNLSVGGEVITYAPSSNSVQQWALEYDGNGYFHIRNKHSALYLEVADNRAGTTLRQQERKDIPAQRWRFVPAGVTPGFDAPEAPQGLTVTPLSASMSLSWEPVAGGMTYDILRAEAGTDDFNTVARALPVSRFLDNTVEGGKVYDYRVVAVDPSLNRSVPSSTVSSSTGFSGLVGGYYFAGDLDDYSGNRFDGRALRGTPEYDKDANGNPALRMKANQRIQLPYTVMQQGPNFTVAMNLCRMSVGEGLYFFSTGSGEEDESFNISLFDGGRMRVSASSGGRSGEICAESPAMRQWVHVAVAVDTESKDATLYVDGQPAGSSSLLAEAVPEMRLLTYLGAGQDLNQLLFNGMIRNLQIYNRSLTADEIADLYSESSSLDRIGDNKTVVSREYYTPGGIRLGSLPQDGTLVIVRTRWSDGTVTTSKQL